MYSQEASKDQGFLDRHIIDNLVFSPQPGKEEDEKQKYYSYSYIFKNIWPS